MAIPYAVEQCGLCLGLFLLVFLAYAICQIIIVLMECGLKAGKLNLEDLSGYLFGRLGTVIGRQCGDVFNKPAADIQCCY